ncbi:tyrosine-type recombinase/integrase [Blautia producta]|uniref:Site-specific integrase n=3 Tax=Lachnospiraceae TaxID=186803 RepID=A0A7G5MU99_9FIRM|nr:tyrosine-type recombinase/integrase [Blautia producta]QIB53674.1 site-specific integrase [Blautia producta ATCC 27340 = DSM 2950]QMW78192.1 site-specific integrase [Blautia producta]HDF2668460.1 site-specific integrase [Clostridioides difficile]
MANSRKDHKGRKLREGESWRSDGRYSYRYTDIRTGKRLTVYAQDLPELREKEKQIVKDMEDNILTDGAIKKMTLNTLFIRYMSTRELAESTRTNYINTWNNRVKDEIGNIKVVQMLPSHVKAYYAKLSKAGYAYSTIKFIHNMLYPALEMAVDDDIIRKNPAKGSISDYGRPAEERVALTISQQEKLLAFVQKHNVYNAYYPMLTIMIGTGVRCGELIGLTWKDVDTKARTVSIDHQLIYKNLGDGCRFHISAPKTDSGIRTIPMTQDVLRAFEEQRKINFMLGKGKDVEVEGYKGFIFMAKTGRPLMPSAVNNVLYNIVDAYNKEEVKAAKKDHRKAELLPKISAHIMRHTACTRMAECRMDIKVLQYIMGHAHIDVTMEVYNHLGDRARIENEIAKLDSMAVNF